MGRELKRVPLNFDWPNNKVWDGYIGDVQYEVPSGEGYQLWETTSAGSPYSPVFETLEALCDWAEKYGTTFASYTATKEKWMEMLKDNFVYHQIGNVVFI